MKKALIALVIVHLCTCSVAAAFLADDAAAIHHAVPSDLLATTDLLELPLAAYTGTDSSAWTKIAWLAEDSLPSVPPMFVSDPDAVERTPNTFTIATYNTLFLFDGIADSEFRDAPQNVQHAERHVRDVASVISTIDPDFVVLQEVERESDIRNLTEHLDHPYETVFVEGYAGIGQDTCALSRVPISGFGRSWNTQSYPIPGSALDCAQGVATGSKHFWAEVDVGGIPITLIGVHLTAWTLVCERAVIREAEALVIRGIVQDALKQKREVILLGDFNDHDGDVQDKAGSNPISEVFRLLKDVDPSQPGDELLNVAALLAQDERYTAWWDKNSNKFDDGGSEHTQIDTILVSHGLWDRILDVGIDHSTYAYEVSDHWPVYVTFEMPETVERITVAATDPADKPLVLFDESHSESLTTSRERLRIMENPQWREFLDTEQALRLELGCGIEAIHESIDAERLSSGDILVLAGPGESFADSEVETIESFVRSGGGLLVLSSWGNEAANDVLERFGFRFLSGVVRTPSGDWGPEAYWAQVQKGHAVTSDVEGHHVNGSQALVIPLGADRLLTSPEDAWCDSDMDGVADQGEPAGSFTIGAAARIGAGRIVVLGDTSFHDDVWRRNPGSRALLKNAFIWLANGSSRVIEEEISAPLSAPPPITIFYNGTIVTMVSEGETHEAIAIAGDRILDLGSNVEMLDLAGPDTQLIDLDGCAVYPGFIDSHTHFLANGAARFGSIGAAQDAALGYGITLMGEMHSALYSLSEWTQWAEEERLRVRHRLYLIHNNSCGEVIGDWYRDYEMGVALAPRLEIGGVKIFAGRSVCGSEWVRPAFTEELMALSDAGAVVLYGKNEPLFSEEELAEILASCEDLGLQVAIHAFGDLEVEVALAALERTLDGGENHLRHAILHSVFLSDAQISSYERLGVVAIVEPFAPCCEDKDAEAFGDVVLEYYTRWRDLVKSGVNVALNSDWPGTSAEALNPLVRLQAVVTGKQVHSLCGSIDSCGAVRVPQTVSVWEGLRMLTADAAYALHHDHDLGTLEVGKLADLVILSEDPLGVDPETLSSIDVLLTMIGGVIEHETPALLRHESAERMDVQPGPSPCVAFDLASGSFLPLDGFSEGSGEYPGWWVGRSKVPGTPILILDPSDIVVEEGPALSFRLPATGETACTRGFDPSVNASGYDGIELVVRSTNEIAATMSIESIDAGVGGEYPVKESTSDCTFTITETWTVLRFPFETFALRSWIRDAYPNVAPDVNRAGIHEIHLVPLTGGETIEILKLGLYSESDERGLHGPGLVASSFGAFREDRFDPLPVLRLGEIIEGVEVFNGWTYVVDWKTRTLYKVHPETGEHVAFDCGLYGVNDLASDGERLWLIAEDGRTRTFDLESETLADERLGIDLEGEVHGVAHERALYILVYRSDGPAIVEISEESSHEWFDVHFPLSEGELIGLQCLGADPATDLMTLDRAHGMLYRLTQRGTAFETSPYGSVSDILSGNAPPIPDVRGFFIGVENAFFTSVGDIGALYTVPLGIVSSVVEGSLTQAVDESKLPFDEASGVLDWCLEFTEPGITARTIRQALSSDADRTVGLRYQSRPYDPTRGFEGIRLRATSTAPVEVSLLVEIDAPSAAVGVSSHPISLWLQAEDRLHLTSDTRTFEIPFSSLQQEGDEGSGSEEPLSLLQQMRGIYLVLSDAPGHAAEIEIESLALVRKGSKGPRDVVRIDQFGDTTVQSDTTWVFGSDLASTGSWRATEAVMRTVEGQIDWTHQQGGTLDVITDPTGYERGLVGRATVPPRVEQGAMIADSGPRIERWMNTLVYRVYGGAYFPQFAAPCITSLDVYLDEELLSTAIESTSGTILLDVYDEVIDHSAVGAWVSSWGVSQNSSLQAKLWTGSTVEGSVFLSLKYGAAAYEVAEVAESAPEFLANTWHTISIVIWPDRLAELYQDGELVASHRLSDEMVGGTTGGHTGLYVHDNASRGKYAVSGTYLYDNYHIRCSPELDIPGILASQVKEQ